MGGFTTGFLGAVGDAAKKRADERRAQLDQQKAGQADIYWSVIKNPESSADQIQHAQEQLGKLYPKDPQIKQLFEKFQGLLKQAHPGHQPQTGPNAPLEGGGIPPPPQPAQAGTMEGAPGTPPQARGIPPPPQPAPSVASATPAAATTPKGQDPRFAEMAKLAAGPTPAEEDERKFQLFKRQQTLLKDFKIEEEQAKAKATADAKAANPTGRPVMGPAVSVFNAKRLATQGKAFLDEDGDPIDLSTLPDSMGLKFVAWGGKHYYIPFSPNEKVLTVGNETYAVNPMDVEALLAGGGTDLGQHLMPSTTSTTDPATGQTTTAKHVPTTTGVRTFSGGAAATPQGRAPAAAPGAAPPRMPPIAKAGGPGGAGPATPAPSTTPPTQAQGLPPADPDGGIPESVTKFNNLPISPQVREGANQLLKSERDVKDLPAKTKELSASLARAYGWDQNAFTPLERRQIGVASHFIDNLMANPNLGVLDQDWWSQIPMIGATGDVGKEGLLSKLGTKLASRNISDEEADFLRDYRQLASVISGLGKLSRGGRVTESTVNRLLSDLPNPSNTKDSKDAVRRLQLLKQEIDTALDNGTFEQVSKEHKRRSSITPPPKPTSSGTKPMGAAARNYLQSHGMF